jgi:hypothetical protein
MDNETGVQNPSLHSLISLEDFKAILGTDDREDALSRYCLTAATYTIEQHCRRRLFLKRHFERIEPHGDPLLSLREYPVREVLEVWGVKSEERGEELLGPDLYRMIPYLEAETGEGPEDTIYSLSLALNRGRGFPSIKVVYRAGYACGEAPADLASACLELAAWNMNRYRGRRIGINGAVRGSGKDGEHLENSMPENVRQLLEPYKRRTI